MKLNEKQIANVMALAAAKRYDHFVKVAADQRQVWGLYSDGWALAKTDAGEEVFPLWPASEYAERCAGREWSGYKPREIDLDTLFEVLIPKLRESRTLVGVFPTPQEKSVTPSLVQLEDDLKQELAKIE
ncbi:MAG: DUF2750 domain-containing protein [Kiritimatiellae bacterium]|nr:DUF2750 domain-containing protein [Kiritimatiellia bacterium]MCO5062660.1 DUF2750 domain-containing protein [Kiritimatiellia bacterium]MCO5068565.1 DUF2750 domain-containing protein [Kiritimatiellia bacterium]